MYKIASLFQGESSEERGTLNQLREQALLSMQKKSTEMQ
jgi:uncharacterized protein YbjQ (UPF0145 family)